ncbi:hypothetical protein LXL04_039412 [Taraxacum kok-saghyz]
MLRPRPQVRRDYPLITASEPGSAQLENRAALLSELSVLSGGPGPSPLEGGAGEGESPVVSGPCRTTRRCLRVGLFGNAAPIGRVLEIVGREANGGRRCVPVGCGTALAGLPIDSGRGPVRIGAAAKAWAVDRPVEMPSCRLWLAARAVTACLGTCALPAPACGHPIRPVLKHGTRSLTCVRHACRDPKDGELCLSGAKPEETLVEARSDTDVQIVRLTWVGRCGCFVEPCHGIESSKWAIFGKQNWRCGMNRKPGYGAKLRANLEPTKGVGRLRQQDGGHGRGRGGRCKTLGVSLGGAAVGADLGGSSKYSNENFEGRRGESLPTLETTQSEVGSSGWKSTARRAVSGAPPAALENPEDRVPPTPGRTHNRIRSPRAGHGGPSPEPVGCQRTARAASAARAGRRVPAGGRTGNGSFGGLPRASNSQLRTVKKFNQARVNGGSNYDSLKRGNAPLFGPKACFGGPIRAEDIVRIHQVLDCSPTNRERELGLDRRETESGLEATRVPAACLPTSSRGLGPQRHVSLAKPVRRISRTGCHEV